MEIDEHLKYTFLQFDPPPVQKDLGLMPVYSCALFVSLRAMHSLHDAILNGLLFLLRRRFPHSLLGEIQKPLCFQHRKCPVSTTRNDLRCFVKVVSQSQ